ncbi:STAS domain-containing protein [Desulfonatronovibrio magnus]|uniref:STAS domain-containing protein n=1 Tax=Desulfonatronovibrio magnus TaxID=698827 RepID=UPI0005EAF420|nr:STAS domain-containing protein [Desulfonatronovibrio magnus]
MAEVEIKTDDQGAVMILQGNLNIECAKELHNVIVDTISVHEVIRVDMAQVDGVDLSFLQIVCALYKEAVIEGKKLVFDPVPDRIQNKAEKMGFTEEYTGGYFWKGDVDG